MSSSGLLSISPSPLSTHVWGYTLSWMQQLALGLVELYEVLYFSGWQPVLLCHLHCSASVTSANLLRVHLILLSCYPAIVLDTDIKESWSQDSPEGYHPSLATTQTQIQRLQLCGSVQPANSLSVNKVTLEIHISPVWRSGCCM